jgi:hypothetical protein
MRGAVNQTSDGLALNIKGKVVKVKTVVLQDVAINGKLRGVVTEATEKVIRPHAEVSRWNRLRYVCSIGKYVDVQTRQPVTEAQAAYLVGNDIYYLPATAQN